MRGLGALLVAAVSALLAGTAAAGLVPVPPLPPVTVPATPVPLPAVPTLPAPVVPAAPTQTTAASSPLGLAGAGASTTTSSASGSFTGASSGSSSSSDASGASDASDGSGGSSTAPSSSRRVEHFHSSRSWIGTTGSERRRTTTFMFVLPQASRVVFIVNQVSPACVGIGRFSVAGHAGLNRVRFAGRVRGRQLSAGTYRISARTPSGEVVRRITLVVVRGSAPSPEELTSLRTANTCGGGTHQVSAAAAGTTDAAQPPAQQLPQLLGQPQKEAAGITAPRGPGMQSGVLASSLEHTARALRPLLIALLALSILLLGLASLPPIAVVEPRVNEALMRHRIGIAALGATALVAVAIAFLLS
jgi:hypothetical protein